MINNHLLKCSLKKDSSVCIHDRNIQCLASEMYKVSNRLSPPVFSNIFTQKKISTLAIHDLILSFPDLLLGLYFTFLKTGLKNGSLKIVPVEFAKHTFLELALHRLSLQ